MYMVFCYYRHGNHCLNLVVVKMILAFLVTFGQANLLVEQSAGTKELLIGGYVPEEVL